jgi:V-type H+-transporting ATPase subunit B
MVQEIDHRMVSIKPRLKYNTIGGVNGPLVILDNVSRASHNTVGAFTD